MRVLSLGATGFVGRNVLDALGDAGHTVIAGCRDRTRLPSRFRATARVGDLRDPAYLATCFENIDVVCLTAAWSALYGHAAQSRDYYREPLLAAIRGAAQAGVRRIVLTSALNIKGIENSRSRPMREDLDRAWPHLANMRRLEDELRKVGERGVSTVALRLGTFSGQGGNLGILPVLVPRLRARLVPYIERGRNALPLIDGADVGRAFAAAASTAKIPEGFVALDATAAVVPTFAEVVDFLHTEFSLPRPLFSVSTSAAFAFAACAEWWGRRLGRDPLLTRSIVFLSEECRPETASWESWGYVPEVSWKDSVRAQMFELASHPRPPKMVDSIDMSAVRTFPSLG